MDTCGTGGGPSTFNISTVALSPRLPIQCKHGKSISSTGSAVCWKHWREITKAREAQKLIEDVACILFWLFHPVMCKVLPPEKDLHKNIFYTVDTLINPSKVSSMCWPRPGTAGYGHSAASIPGIKGLFSYTAGRSR